MDHLRTLVSLFREAHPGLKANEALFGHLETTFLPHVLRILRKDNTLLSEVELFPGIKVDWAGTEEQWKALQMALLYSVLHGNPKEKFASVLEAVKRLVPGGSSQADEIESILNDEETKTSMQEMFELVMNTRLASLVGEIVEHISLEDLEIDLEDPKTVIEMLRNPQAHGGLKELMDRAKSILEDKIKTGKINQQELIREVEMLRAKFQSAFGKYLNETVIGADDGPKTGNTSAQILSNSPDARRARMLARLQRKQQEKGRK
jgi:hypothetical protein